MNFSHAGRMLGAMLVIAGGSAVSAQALEVTRVQLGVVDSGGSGCPRDAKVMAWAHANGPGTVKFVIRNDSGGQTGEISVNAVKGPSGNYLATYSHTFKITTDVDIKYMAEAIGHGKISNWVNLRAKCGPQVRTDTKTTKSDAKPPVKKMSDTDTDGPQPHKGKPTTKAAGNTPKGKPISDSHPEGKPTSGGKPIGECKPMLSATRTLAVTRTGGIATAQAAWQATALAGYGASYGRWSNAKDQSSSCVRKGLTFNCTVKARPCKG
jgi:hypothetical protein